MTLNPNAPPWNAPDPSMDHPVEPPHRMGHQDPRLQGYTSFYQPPHAHPIPMMLPHQMPRHMVGHGYSHPAHMPPLPHSPPMQSYNNAKPRGPQQYNAGIMNPMQPVSTPSYKRLNPIVIVVFGYRKVGKSSVGKRIAEVRNFRYISLKPNGDAPLISPTAFVSPLVDLLARKNTFEGIVIDDIVVRNKFEPYYVQSVLQQHGLKFDVAVVLDNDLENTKDRDVEYDDPLQRQLHPESYEFCASYLQGEPTVVIECREKSLEAIVADAIRQVGDINATRETSLTLREVELMPNTPLERNPAVATAVLEAQREHLNLSETALFPFSEPNYLLEYATFARHAYAFRRYMITPWIRGDKVTLIGYQNAVYIHLPMYNIVFCFNDAPPTLMQLAKENVGNNGVGFILEAIFAGDKLYISDMLMLEGVKGSDKLVHERVDMMKAKFGDLNDGMVQLLPWYPVHSIEACDSENPNAFGILFINPDGIMFGEYDSRNFLYPLHKKRTVELRIWNGSFNAGLWTFDAYCEEVGSEKLIEGVPVHISDADVAKYCINDGNILECSREDYHGGPNKARKGAKHYVFQRRCAWMLTPTTTFKQEIFVNDPKWPLERVAQACAAIKYVRASRPEEHTKTEE